MIYLHVVFKPIGSIFTTVFVTTILAHPYFLPKSGEHDVTLTSFAADISELSKIPSVRVCND